MFQAKLLEMFFKALFKHPKIRGLFKYKDEPNELDMAVGKLEKDFDSMGHKVTATVDMIKSQSESIDKLIEGVKSVNKVIDKFDNKLQQIGKIAHPPAIPIKEINEFRETNKNVKWIMGILKNMKKLPLLKSVFKNG